MLYVTYQSRPDRDNYVKILWDNITPKGQHFVCIFVSL